MEVGDFLAAPLRTAVFRSLPRFPAVERDFCFVMPESVSAEAIAQEIFHCSPLVEEVLPFDLYRGEQLGAGRKSIAYSVSLRSPEKTLTDKEAEIVASAVITAIAQKFNATLRTQ